MTCQLSRTGGMPTGNETKLQIPYLFAPIFEHAFLPVILWPDQLEVKGALH